MRPENTVAALLEGAQRIIKGKREFLELLVTAALADHCREDAGETN
jgi:hypothetical protein